VGSAGLASGKADIGHSQKKMNFSLEMAFSGKFLSSIFENLGATICISVLQLQLLSQSSPVIYVHAYTGVLCAVGSLTNCTRRRTQSLSEAVLSSQPILLTSTAAGVRGLALYSMTESGVREHRIEFCRSYHDSHCDIQPCTGPHASVQCPDRLELFIPGETPTRVSAVGLINNNK